MIHLIVGNTGAGKTSYSQKLKKENKGIIYSIDEWNNTLFMPDKTKEDGLNWFLERINRVETLIEKLVLQSEESGLDSILDLGLSKFEHRQKFRNFAVKHNITCQLHYLNIPKEVRWKRVQNRNKNKGDTYQFNVTEHDFNFMENWFESPTASELNGAICMTQ